MFSVLGMMFSSGVAFFLVLFMEGLLFSVLLFCFVGGGGFFLFMVFGVGSTVVLLVFYSLVLKASAALLAQSSLV